MCRLRRLKSFFALRHSTCHLHLISTWVILIETNVQGMHDLSNFKIQLSHDDFKHEVIFSVASLLLKVCICTMTYNVYVAFLGSSRSRRTRRRTQAMMQFSMPDLDASSAHSAICLKINQNELNFEEKVHFTFSNYNDSFWGNFWPFCWILGLEVFWQFKNTLGAETSAVPHSTYATHIATADFIWVRTTIFISPCSSQNFTACMMCKMNPQLNQKTV